MFTQQVGNCFVEKTKQFFRQQRLEEFFFGNLVLEFFLTEEGKDNLFILECGNGKYMRQSFIIRKKDTAFFVSRAQVCQFDMSLENIHALLAENGYEVMQDKLFLQERAVALLEEGEVLPQHINVYRGPRALLLENEVPIKITKDIFEVANLIIPGVIVNDEEDAQYAQIRDNLMQYEIVMLLCVFVLPSTLVEESFQLELTADAAVRNFWKMVFLQSQVDLAKKHTVWGVFKSVRGSQLFKSLIGKITEEMRENEKNLEFKAFLADPKEALGDFLVQKVAYGQINQQRFKIPVMVDMEQYMNNYMGTRDESFLQRKRVCDKCENHGSKIFIASRFNFAGLAEKKAVIGEKMKTEYFGIGMKANRQDYLLKFPIAESWFRIALPIDEKQQLFYPSLDQEKIMGMINTIRLQRVLEVEFWTPLMQKDNFKLSRLGHIIQDIFERNEIPDREIFCAQMEQVIQTSDHLEQLEEVAKAMKERKIIVNDKALGMSPFPGGDKKGVVYQNFYFPEMFLVIDQDTQLKQKKKQLQRRLMMDKHEGVISASIWYQRMDQLGEGESNFFGQMKIVDFLDLVVAMEFFDFFELPFVDITRLINYEEFIDDLFHIDPECWNVKPNIIAQEFALQDKNTQIFLFPHNEQIRQQTTHVSKDMTVNLLDLKNPDIQVMFIPEMLSDWKVIQNFNFSSVYFSSLAFIKQSDGLNVEYGFAYFGEEPENYVDKLQKKTIELVSLVFALIKNIIERKLQQEQWGMIDEYIMRISMMVLYQRSLFPGKNSTKNNEELAQLINSHLKEPKLRAAEEKMLEYLYLLFLIKTWLDQEYKYAAGDDLFWTEKVQYLAFPQKYYLVLPIFQSNYFPLLMDGFIPMLDKKLQNRIPLESLATLYREGLIMLGETYQINTQSFESIETKQWEWLRYLFKNTLVVEMDKESDKRSLVIPCESLGDVLKLSLKEVVFVDGEKQRAQWMFSIDSLYEYSNLLSFAAHFELFSLIYFLSRFAMVTWTFSKLAFSDHSWQAVNKPFFGGLQMTFAPDYYSYFNRVYETIGEQLIGKRKEIFQESACLNVVMNAEQRDKVNGMLTELEKKEQSVFCLGNGSGKSQVIIPELVGQSLNQTINVCSLSNKEQVKRALFDYLWFSANGRFLLIDLERQEVERAFALLESSGVLQDQNNPFIKKIYLWEVQEFVMNMEERLWAFQHPWILDDFDGYLSIDDQVKQTFDYQMNIEESIEADKTSKIIEIVQGVLGLEKEAEKEAEEEPESRKDYSSLMEKVLDQYMQLDDEIERGYFSKSQQNKWCQQEVVRMAIDKQIKTVSLSNLVIQPRTNGRIDCQTGFQDSWISFFFTLFNLFFFPRARIENINKQFFMGMMDLTQFDQATKNYLFQEQKTSKPQKYVQSLFRLLRRLAFPVDVSYDFQLPTVTQTDNEFRFRSQFISTLFQKPQVIQRLEKNGYDFLEMLKIHQCPVIGLSATPFNHQVSQYFEEYYQEELDYKTLTEEVIRLTEEEISEEKIEKTMEEIRKARGGIKMESRKESEALVRNLFVYNQNVVFLDPAYFEEDGKVQERQFRRVGEKIMASRTNGMAFLHDQAIDILLDPNGVLWNVSRSHMRDFFQQYYKKVKFMDGDNRIEEGENECLFVFLVDSGNFELKGQENKIRNIFVLPKISRIKILRNQTDQRAFLKAMGKARFADYGIQSFVFVSREFGVDESPKVYLVKKPKDRFFYRINQYSIMDRSTVRRMVIENLDCICVPNQEEYTKLFDWGEAIWDISPQAIDSPSRFNYYGFYYMQQILRKLGLDSFEPSQKQLSQGVSAQLRIGGESVKFAKDHDTFVDVLFRGDMNEEFDYNVILENQYLFENQYLNQEMFVAAATKFAILSKKVKLEMKVEKSLQLFRTNNYPLFSISQPVPPLDIEAKKVSGMLALISQHRPRLKANELYMQEASKRKRDLQEGIFSDQVFANSQENKYGTWGVKGGVFILVVIIAVFIFSRSQENKKSKKKVR